MMQSKKTARCLIHISDAAKYLGISPRALRTLVVAGEVASIGVSKRCAAFDTADLDAYTESLRTSVPQRLSAEPEQGSSTLLPAEDRRSRYEWHEQYCSAGEPCEHHRITESVEIAQAPCPQIAQAAQSGVLGEWAAWLAMAPLVVTVEAVRALSHLHMRAIGEFAAYCALHRLLGVPLTVILVGIGVRYRPRRE